MIGLQTGSVWLRVTGRQQIATSGRRRRRNDPSAVNERRKVDVCLSRLPADKPAVSSDETEGRKFVAIFWSQTYSHCRICGADRRPKIDGYSGV